MMVAILMLKWENTQEKQLLLQEIYGRRYKIEEDREKWYWTDEMFEGLAEYTYEDLCNAPVGTKLTFEGGNTLIKAKEETYSCENIWSSIGNFRNNDDLKKIKDNWGDFGKIIKIEEPSYTTVYEAKDILDEKEREYLSNVIKPFKDKVEYISKYKYYDEANEFLVIAFKEKDKSLEFPDFKPNTMYRGMEANREYSLKELGLN